MALQTFSWTDSPAKYKEGWPLYQLTRRAADRLSLELSPTSCISYSECMSQQGLLLLEERNERLKSATTPEAVQEIYTAIREKSELIDYSQPVV